MQIQLSKTILNKIEILSDNLGIDPSDFINSLVIDYIKNNKDMILNLYPSSNDYEAYTAAYKLFANVKPSKATIAQRLAFLAENREEKNPNVSSELIILQGGDYKDIANCLKWLIRKYSNVLEGIDTLVNYLPFKLDLKDGVSLEDLEVIKYVRSNYPSLVKASLPNIISLKGFDSRGKHTHLARRITILLKIDETKKQSVIDSLVDSFKPFEKDTEEKSK